MSRSLPFPFLDNSFQGEAHSSKKTTFLKESREETIKDMDRHLSEKRESQMKSKAQKLEEGIRELRESRARIEQLEQKKLQEKLEKRMKFTEHNSFLIKLRQNENDNLNAKASLTEYFPFTGE